MLPRPVIHARTIALQCQLSLERGVRESELTGLGLAPAALEVPDAMVPGEAVYAHLELTASRTPFEPFAIELARRHRASSLGLVGFLLKTSADVRQGLSRFRRWQHLSSTLGSIELLEGPRGLLWVEHRHGPATEGSRLATEIAATTTLQIMREMVGPALTPIGVALRRPEVDRAAYAAFFGCPIETGAADGQMRLPASIFEQPVVTADPEMGAWFERVAEEKSRASEAPLSGQLRHLLAATLQDGGLPLDQASRRLALSPRTLQRRLQEEGATYESVLDGLRHDLARGYLGDPRLLAAEVGYLLGFSEPAAFYKAFRRWTGTTPEAFRRAQSESPGTEKRSSNRAHSTPPRAALRRSPPKIG